MAEVVFNFKGVETTIQCNINDKMKEIKNKFITKTQNEENKIYFLYNGDKINEELSFSQQANELDNQTKKMKILVYEKVENKENKKEIKSKEIICPDCGENILIKFLDNKINYMNVKMVIIKIIYYMKNMKILKKQNYLKLYVINVKINLEIILIIMNFIYVIHVI